jgi:tetratricopeptide (TPR) repeat protein
MTAHPRASALELEALERGIALCRDLGDRRGLYFGLTLAVFRFGKVGRLDDAWRAVEEAQALHGDDLPPGLLPQLVMPRAHLHAGRGDYAAAAADKLAALRAYERLGDESQVRLARDNLADMALARGDVQEAVRLGRENAAALRRRPRAHMYSCAGCFANLSAALTRAGEFGEAQQMAREAIPLLQRRGWTHLYLDVLALLALKLGRTADAARALGRSRAVVGASGDAREINEQRAHDDALAGLREAFVPDELERLFVEGAALSDEEAARTAVDGFTT